MGKRRLVAAGALMVCTAVLCAQQPGNGVPNAQLATKQQSDDATSVLSQAPNTPPGQALTRQQAEQMALKNNPQVSVAALLSRAQAKHIQVTRSALFPTLNGELTGVDAEEATRISTGSLSASRLLYHAGAGIELDQLITDFGRTRNLIQSSSFEAKATEQKFKATREDILLAADAAFYRALEAQSTLKVAASTVKARQVVNQQVGALTESKLKSTLDQSFAQVNLSQAKLLNLNAQNEYEDSIASLNEVLGTSDDTHYQLVDDPTLPEPVAPTVEAVIALALQQRPDLLALVETHNADVHFAKAQRDQLFPTVSGLGVVGATPVGSNQYFTQNWYGAAGINVSIPIFNGFKYHSEAAEADLRANASDERRKVLVNRIVRDVRAAWLRSDTARQRMGVTAELLKQANTALDLADTRYRLGLSSIVELSQAQLQQTQAQIDDANARFEFEQDLAALRYQSGVQP